MRFRFTPILLLVALAAAACSDDPASPSTPAAAPNSSVTSGREQLALALAKALNDPVVRASLKRRLDASHAPEGKLQFQGLLRADQGALLASIARAEATTVTDLLAQLDAVRPLELYLPVAAHRAAWNGGDELLVATIERDGEAPLAFDVHGNARRLDANRPPATPVLALVPQEYDFTGGRPSLLMQCFDGCAGGGGSGGESSAYAAAAGSGQAGLYITQAHFDDSYESWLKGNPEYEFHVYGAGDGSDAVQLACAGEHAGGAYAFDQNGNDWYGSVMLLSDAERATYEAKHPSAPVRIIAWEDDDEACVPRADGNRIATLLTAVDAAYKAVTSGKVEPWYFRGIKAAPSVFALLRAVRNAITTGDDIIGNAVEASVAGAPAGANWSLKADGARTTGWFTTEYRH